MTGTRNRINVHKIEKETIYSKGRAIIQYQQIILLSAFLNYEEN